jgi:hypothetical protein
MDIYDFMYAVIGFVIIVVMFYWIGHAFKN